jgi:predicted glycoside hydrolase/deacetylase ChbG (UPF0249 family)
VTIARQAPTLAVGLHLVMAGGKAALPPAQNPHIVDQNGHFPGDPVVAGLRYFSSSTAQTELAAEMEAQFERFAATGLPLSHVDGHMHPTVFRLLLPLAEEHGAQGLRLPCDDFRLSVGYDGLRIVPPLADPTTGLVTCC